MTEASIIGQDIIDDSVTRLYWWLDTWKQEDGAFNGPVVHRYDLKRLKEIHETPWGHCAIIEGMLSLYEKKPSKMLQTNIESAVALQISRLDADGSFINAGFEDDRFSSLVHNSMADRALLAYYKSDIENVILKSRVLEVVKKNIDDYLIGMLWNEDIEAFKFSKVDYYSLDVVRYVANMNCVAIEAMLGLYEILGEKKYLDYSRRCGNWVKTQVVHSDNKLRDGSISYGSNNPECLVSIYTGLCLPGICKLYETFKDEDYKEIAIGATENLLIYTEEGYFCHSMIDEEEKRYPFFLAGAGIILYGIQCVNEVFGVQYNITPYLKKILARQYRMGAVQNFIHYDSEDNNRERRSGKHIVWEDIVPCVPWNAQLFRFLAKNSNGLTKEMKVPVEFFVGVGYAYFESKKHCVIVSIYPLKSVALIIINKKKNRSIIAFSLKEAVGKMRKIIQR